MKNLYKNNSTRNGKCVLLGVGINTLIHSLDQNNEETKKAYVTAKVQNMFKECCKKLYKDSAFLVLQNINAVYILNERDKGMLKEARPKDKHIKRLAVYTCDSMVYADLDSRQEFIKLWFADNGERIDYLDLYSSKFNMRKRFPYKNDCSLMKNIMIDNQNNKKTLEPPQNLDQLIPLIEKIKNENLKKALKNLII